MQVGRRCTGFGTLVRSNFSNTARCLCCDSWVPLGAARVSLGAGAGMVGALRTLAMLSLATVVRGDFRVKFEVEVRSGTKEFTVLVHEDWAPSLPPTARTPH